MDLYILDEDNNVVRLPLGEIGSEEHIASLRRWGEWMEVQGHRQVADDKIGGRLRVSTVFLGLDHSFSNEGPPVLWETMVFWVKPVLRELLGRERLIHEEWNNWQVRYTSQADALKGHRRAIAVATRALQELDTKTNAEK